MDYRKRNILYRFDGNKNKCWSCRFPLPCFLSHCYAVSPFIISFIMLHYFLTYFPHHLCLPFSLPQSCYNACFFKLMSRRFPHYSCSPCRDPLCFWKSIMSYNFLASSSSCFTLPIVRATPVLPRHTLHHQRHFAESVRPAAESTHTRGPHSSARHGTEQRGGAAYWKSMTTTVNSLLYQHCFFAMLFLLLLQPLLWPLLCFYYYCCYCFEIIIQDNNKEGSKTVIHTIISSISTYNY